MIRSLLFDFGDVFLNLDKKATVKTLQGLGLEDFSAEMIQYNKDYEVGGISSEEFLNFYRKKMPHVAPDLLKKAWNSVLIDLPEHRLNFLQQLHKSGDFQLILFSNTNDFHINWVKQHIPQFKDFKKCFDAFYLSHEINLRKPNTDSFQFILTKHQLNPEEVLFVDDTAENTATAKKLGMHVWNLDPEKEDVTQLFTVKEELF